jgi:hypothetical protein
MGHREVEMLPKMSNMPKYFQAPSLSSIFTVSLRGYFSRIATHADAGGVNNR